MIPDLAGQKIIKVHLDWGLRLWTDGSWELSLAQPIVVTTSDESGVQQEEFDPDVAERDLPPSLAGLEDEVVVQVLVSRDGDLGLQLPDRHLTVRASARFEAWQLSGPGGEMLICSPGGELTHFPPRVP